MSNPHLPAELDETMRKAVRLEYWNPFWSATIIIVMGMVLGQSQTMKAAWIEDTLGLVPPLMFLLAARIKRKGRPSKRFPFGFHRVNGLGFFVAAVALAAVGAILLYDAISALVAAEHPSVASIVIFGHEILAGLADDRGAAGAADDHRPQGTAACPGSQR